MHLLIYQGPMSLFTFLDQSQSYISSQNDPGVANYDCNILTTFVSVNLLSKSSRSFNELVNILPGDEPFKKCLRKLLLH